MSKRQAAREEASFMRGETGVDGQATEEKNDPALLEQEKAQEQFLRGKAYLGREFLTWLLWKSESTGPLCELDGVPVTALFTDRLSLKGIAGEVVELMARGQSAPYSATVRETLARGLLPCAARIRLTAGDQAFEVSIDAEHLDLRSAKLPDLLAEDEDDRIIERIDRAEALSRLLDAIVRTFLGERATRRWGRTLVPALRSWMEERA